MGHNMSETALLLAMHGRPEDPPQPTPRGTDMANLRPPPHPLPGGEEKR